MYLINRLWKKRYSNADSVTNLNRTTAKVGVHDDYFAFTYYKRKYK